jgi:hypothetical protein
MRAVHLKMKKEVEIGTYVLNKMRQPGRAKFEVVA